MSEHDDNPRGLRSVGRRLLSVFSRSDARKPAETPPNDPDELRCEETDGEADVVVNAAVLRNESESEDATGKGTDSQEHESTPNATIEPRGAAPNVWLTLWEKVVPYDGWGRLEDKEALAEEASSHRADRFAAAFIRAEDFTRNDEELKQQNIKRIVNLFSQALKALEILVAERAFTDAQLRTVRDVMPRALFAQRALAYCHVMNDDPDAMETLRRYAKLMKTLATKLKSGSALATLNKEGRSKPEVKKQVLHEHIRERFADADEASYMEIYAFVRDELPTRLNKAQLALSVNDFMSRVSVDRFVADWFVYFDAVRIDARIERILHEAGTEYLPLKGFADKLADFPFCGQEWNLFVLESYVRRFSEKFRLLTHEPNSVNVGIVVKRTSTLTTERQILRDAIVRASVPAASVDVDQIHAWLVEKGYRFMHDEELLVELGVFCEELGVLPSVAAPTDSDRMFAGEAPQTKTPAAPEVPEAKTKYDEEQLSPSPAELHFYESKNVPEKKTAPAVKTAPTPEVDERVLRERLRERFAGASEASYDEIYAFVRDELHTTLNKARLALSVNDFMSRVSVDRFVADRFMRFDVDQIDARIERILNEANAEYLPLKGFADKLVGFPSCGHEWNLFVLETFVRRFSEKFRFLTHEPNSDNLGVVVKRSSTLTTERKVLEHAFLCDAVPADAASVDYALIQRWLVEKGYRCNRDEELLATLGEYCESFGVLPTFATPTDTYRSFYEDEEYDRHDVDALLALLRAPCENETKDGETPAFLRKDLESPQVPETKAERDEEQLTPPPPGLRIDEPENVPESNGAPDEKSGDFDEADADPELAPESDERRLRRRIRERFAGADEASYMEIFAFVRDELHTTLNKARLALSVNDFMSRVSVNVFVADRFVRFDVDRIDARIERILHEAGTEYLALKGFADKLADFPPCGHEWNLFVLETFVRRFSEKFRLLTHEPNSVNVGIVVKRSSTLTTERQILRDAIVRASVPADVDQIHAWLVEKGYRFKRDEELLAELADCCASLGVLPPNAAPTDADRSFHDDATTPVSESVAAENKDDFSNWNKDETEEEDSENSSEATDDDEEEGDDENDEDNEDKDDVSDWVFGGVPLEKILFRTRVGYGDLASLNGAEPKVIEHNSEAMLKVLKELESCAPQCVVHQDFSYVEYKPGVWNDLKASVESRSHGRAESVKGSYTLMTRPYVATEIADRILTADRYVLEECVSAPIVVQEALILIDLYEEVDKMERLAPKKKELLRDALAYSTTLMAAVYFLATTYPTLGVFKGAILRIKEYLSQEYWDKVWSCQRYYPSRAYTKWKVGEWRQRVSRALSSGVGTVRTLLVNPAVDVYDVVYNTALQRVYESGDVQAECDGSLMLRSLCRSRRRDPSADALFEYGRCFLYGIGFTSSLYRRKPEDCKRIGFRRVRQAARRRCARARRLALELALTQDDCRGWAKKLLWKRALKDKKDALAILARYYAVEDANAQ